MIVIRKAEDRGHANYGWLDSYHSFSFANYYDPNYMGFHQLRVINEDRISGGRGFDTHSHRDMEIITYVVDGALEHRDSMGNKSVIRSGEVQRMSAGTGIAHSEYNHSSTDPVHLLQIWIFPDRRGLQPSYEQRHYSEVEKWGNWRLIVSPDDRENALNIHQDVKVYATVLESGESIDYPILENRYAWIQVIKGEIAANDRSLKAGDGAAIHEATQLQIKARSSAELLLFDLA